MHSHPLLKALHQHRGAPEVRRLREVTAYYEKRLDVATAAAYGSGEDGLV